MIPPHIEEAIRREIIYTALKNSVINEKPVFGAIMKAHAAELKPIMEELRARIEEIAEEYRAMDAPTIKDAADRFAVAYVEKDTTKDMIALEVDGAFRVRIAPEPSKHLHVGHAIHSYINALYAERYGGDLVLRFEDTNPLLAREEYVESILEDLDYLNLVPTLISFASAHLDVCDEAMLKLIGQGDAYVCFCDRDSMAQLRRSGEECGCRGKPSEEHLHEFENMRSGVYAPGDAVVRFAGDMTHKNAAMRDPVLARIITEPHYRLGDSRRVWPLYDLENVVLDSREGITHIIRDNSFGEMRAELQRELSVRLALPRARVYQYGRLRIEGKETSGRAIREAIKNGEYSGWDDPRLATLKTMKRRGFASATFRDIAREVGLSPTQTRVDEKMLAKYNRRHVDRSSKRYSFIYDPERIVVEDYEPRDVKLKSHPELATSDRSLHASGVFLIRGDDALVERFRLIEAGNIKREDGRYRLVSESVEDFRSSGATAIINWLPETDHRACLIVMPDGSMREGLVETAIVHEPVGAIVQLERFGFGRIDAHEADRTIIWYAHQ